MENSQTNQKRQIAYKVQISEILNGEYVREDGWAPNYVIIGKDNVSRINLIGIIIAKTENNGNSEILIDDKTGIISTRAFDKSSIFNNVKIGDVISIIGRPREYNDKKYIVPEIIKKVNKSWLELRFVELSHLNKVPRKQGIGPPEEKDVVDTHKNH